MELYSIIKVTELKLVVECDWIDVLQVQNIDFDHQYERGRELPRIAGMILDFSVIKKGSDIGYFSGKPVKLRDRDNGRGAENHLLQDSLSQKLWKQVKPSLWSILGCNFIILMKVKEERFCDVTFTFPDSTAAGHGQVVKAQKNALIANSPVFEVNAVATNVAGNFFLVPGPI